MRNLVTVAITTDASGDFTGYAGPFDGFIHQFRYVPDGSTPLDTNADLTITGDTTGQTIYSDTNIGTSAFTKAPRQPTHDTAGDALLYAAAGLPVEDRICINGERIKVVVAQGGNATSGTLYLWVD